MPGGNQANPLIVGSVSRLVDKTLTVPVLVGVNPGQAACALALGGAGRVSVSLFAVPPAPPPLSVSVSLFTSDAGVNDATALPIGAVDQMIDSFILLDELDATTFSGTQAIGVVNALYDITGAFLVCLIENVNLAVPFTTRVFLRGMS